MAAAALKMKIRFRWAWWLRWYLQTLALLCVVFDAEPNWKRADRWIVRGLVVEWWNGSRWKRVL